MIPYRKLFGFQIKNITSKEAYMISPIHQSHHNIFAQDKKTEPKKKLRNS